MKKADSLVRKLLFVTLGVVVAGLALLLILRGLRALRTGPDGGARAAESSIAPSTPAGESQKDAESSRRWEEFAGGQAPDPDRQTTALRPIERLPRHAASPFDRAYARQQLGRLGLRLEGVGRGEEMLALISGRVVGVGDRVGDYYVESIDRSAVSLTDPNGIRLDLVPQERSAGGPRALAQSGGGQAGSGRWSQAGQGSSGWQSQGGQGSSVWRSEDGLRARPHFSDGRLDVDATDMNLRIQEWQKKRRPWPEAPFPQPPAAYYERDRLPERYRLPKHRSGS